MNLHRWPLSDRVHTHTRARARATGRGVGRVPERSKRFVSVWRKLAILISRDWTMTMISGPRDWCTVQIWKARKHYIADYVVSMAGSRKGLIINHQISTKPAPWLHRGNTLSVFKRPPRRSPTATMPLIPSLTKPASRRGVLPHRTWVNRQDISVSK